MHRTWRTLGELMAAANMLARDLPHLAIGTAIIEGWTEYGREAAVVEEYVEYKCGDGMLSIWWSPDGKDGSGRGAR